MGRATNCCPCIKRRKTKKIVLLLVGLDNAGKTTTARQLMGSVIQDIIPTVGFTSIKLKHRGVDVSIYDLGGGKQIRAIWRSYFSDVHGVIFVVDASDASRIEECKRVLENLLRDEKLAGKPVLVLANKQDKPGAMDQVDLVEGLRLESLVNEQKCLTLIEECSATNYSQRNKIDSRLLNGYRWLVNQISHDFETLNDRVELDRKIEAEKFEAHRKQLRERLGNNLQNGHPGMHTTTTNGMTDKLPYGNNIIQVSPPPVDDGSPSSEENNSSSERDYGESSRGDDQIQMLTKHVKEQLERHSSRGRHKPVKKNKILPLEDNENGINYFDDKASVVVNREIFSNDLRNEDSLMLKALTSPIVSKRDRLPPIRVPKTLRPPTSKSLGAEGRAWDLHKELEVVDPHKIGKNVEVIKVKNFRDVEPT